LVHSGGAQITFRHIRTSIELFMLSFVICDDHFSILVRRRNA